MNVNFRASHLNLISNADKMCHKISDTIDRKFVSFSIIVGKEKSICGTVPSQKVHGASTKVENI